MVGGTRLERAAPGKRRRFQDTEEDEGRRRRRHRISLETEAIGLASPRATKEV
jgi:hypothetical protein